MDKDIIQQIENFVLDKMKITGLPSLSMSIVLKDQNIYNRGFGRRSLESGQSATSKTLYNIGSVAKSFTALAIMQLQEKGKLNITDPVNKYLDFNIKPEGKDITIEHLLTHTSGIPALGYASPLVLNSVGEEVQYTPIGNINDMLAFMGDSQEWTVSEPGKRWFYLNEGFVLLGGIIEEVSGLSYQEYLKGNILYPLGMNRTFFTREEVENDDDFAQPYLIKNNRCEAKSYLYGDIASDGGIISNTEDMVRYVQLFINPDNTKIISANSIAQMIKPRISIPSFELYRHRDNKNIKSDYNWNNCPKNYGYGLIVDKAITNHITVGHGGSSLVATAQMDFIPEEGLGIIILANGSGYLLNDMSKYIISILVGENPDKLAFRQGETRIDQLTGNYHAYKNNMNYRVSRKGDMLILRNIDTSLSEDIILIPDEFTKEKMTFFTLSHGQRIEVEFYQQEKYTELLYERVKLIKTAQE